MRSTSGEGGLIETPTEDRGQRQNVVPGRDPIVMTMHAATLTCSSQDCEAVFDVFVRRLDQMPACCQFCGAQLQELWFDDRGSAPDEAGDDVQVIVVSAPRRHLG